MKALLILSFLFIACQYFANATTSDPIKLCRLMKSGTRFRRPGTCNEYITCNNQTGAIFSCTSPYAYDTNKMACIERFGGGGNCDTTNYCAGIRSAKWVANPNNCNGYFYCANGAGFPGFCEPGFFFNEDKQICDFAETSGCDVVPNICAFLPDKTKFRDDKDCTVYYECNRGKKSRQSCKNTYFNVDTGKCVDKSLVACTTHPKPSKICGTDSRPSPGFKSDGATCRGYFYCKDLGIVPDLEPVWGQCPAGLFFDEETESCAHPLNVTCEYNRCEGRPDGIVLSSSNNCRNYVTCKNGITMEERTCSGDKFFDEFAQACVHYVVAQPCCDDGE